MKILDHAGVQLSGDYAIYFLEDEHPHTDDPYWTVLTKTKWRDELPDSWLYSYIKSDHHHIWSIWYKWGEWGEYTGDLLEMRRYYNPMVDAEEEYEHIHPLSESLGKYEDTCV